MTQRTGDYKGYSRSPVTQTTGEYNGYSRGPVTRTTGEYNGYSRAPGVASDEFSVRHRPVHFGAPSALQVLLTGGHFIALHG